MKLIKPSFEIIPFDPNPLMHIERIARTCYKSEDKITEYESYYDSIREEMSKRYPEYDFFTYE